MTRTHQAAGWVFWLQWVVASTLALPGAAVVLVVDTRIGAQEFEGVRDYGMIGAETGAAQWLVLRRYSSSWLNRSMREMTIACGF